MTLAFDIPRPSDVPPFASEGRRRPYYVVDAFTREALGGNPVAVFPESFDLDASQMQALARELNLSETVFLLPAGRGGDVRARIFTPRRELPFAGHPLLGVAILLAHSPASPSTVRIETANAIVPVTIEHEASAAPFGWMEQPLPDFEEPPELVRLAEALGAQPSGLPVRAYRNGPVHVMVELADPDQVAALEPDMNALERIFDGGVYCFAQVDERTWKARLFAPALGVFEDPATGSAAGPLAVHLGRHERVPFGEVILIRQGGEIHRPSELHARAEARGQRILKVSVGGSGVVVASGWYRVE